MTGPRISIIVPLADHRGHALEGLQSWLQQSIDDGDIEVVVICDGREPELEQLTRTMLRPHDVCFSIEEGSLHDCYNAGARAAAADLLLFTESHVKADPTCTEQIIARMSVGDLDLAALASGGINESRFAAQEQTIYEEALAARIAEGWNLCTVRGFAVTRSAFESSGGFLSRYGHFSELLLGAMLKHQGQRLGYAPQARVWHFNDGTREHFARELAAFGRDEIRFRAENPNSPLLAYLGPCPLWERRERYERAAACREVGDCLARAAKGIMQLNLKESGRGLEAAVRAIPFIGFGPAWLLWRATLRQALNLGSLQVSSPSDHWYYAAFRRYWNSEIRRGRAQAVTEWLRQPQPCHSL